MPRRRKLLIQKIASLVVSIAVLSALLLGVAYYQQGITFKDSNLETVIGDKLDNPAGPISRGDLLQITHLDASGQDIVNLEGIENLTRLVYLDLGDNQIGDLSPLQNLSRLNGLNLSENKITCLGEVNLDAITGLPLRSLSLRHNVVRPEEGGQVRLYDIILLGELTSLEELELRDNHIADISPLSNLSSLSILDLRENRIEDISALENLTELTELNLRENEIKDVSDLSALTNLTYLNLHSNKDIQTVMPLKTLANLETLILRNVPVGDEISVLEKMTNLNRLNLRDTGIADLQVLASLMHAGALQDDREVGVEAELDIRGNRFFSDDLESYLALQQQWGNITNRAPEDYADFSPRLRAPIFSHPGGFYEDPIALTLDVSDPEISIYYTLDGSEPCPDNLDGTVYYYKQSYSAWPGEPFGDLFPRTYRSYLYQEPLLITADGPGKGENFQDCICTINTSRFGGPFKPPGDVLRATVIRAVAYKEGYMPSEVVTHSYFVGEGIREQYHVPVISLVTGEASLFDYEAGIYIAGQTFDEWREENPAEESIDITPANYHHRGSDWERKANIEIYSAGEGPLINQGCGVRVHGGWTRGFARKKSLRIYAKAEYGEDLFNIRFFPGRETEKYKRFILRNSGNDHASTLFRDALMQSLVKDINIDRQEYQSAALFINGIYWGIHNIRDRYDRYYLKYAYDLDPDNIDLLQDNARVREGDALHYHEMLRFIETEDQRDPGVYSKINQLMDIESFINLNVAQIYYANIDWPHNNMDFWRLRTGQYEPDAPHGHDGRWRWMLNDTDHGFGLGQAMDLKGGIEHDYEHNTLKHASQEGSWSTFLFRSLLKNDSFRYEFINRFADYMNTIFDSEIVIGKIDAMQDNLAPLMQEQINRWGQPGSYAEWQGNVEVMRTFARKRSAYVRSHIIDKFNLDGTAQLTLLADTGAGKIKINSITLTEDSPGIENPGNWTGVYFKDIPVTISAIPRPGYRFAGWEGLESKERELTLILDSDITLTAVFERE